MQVLLRHPDATLLGTCKVVILIRTCEVTALNIPNRQTFSTSGHFPHTLLARTGGQALVLFREMVTRSRGVSKRKELINFMFKLEQNIQK